MRREELVRSLPPLRKLNSAWSRFRRNQWRFDPRFRRGEAVPIDRPIFLLGTYGGGLTLLGRILRRHPQVVSFTGNARLWAAEDEMHHALRDALPPELTWRSARVEGFEPGDEEWLYACDAFLPHYRADASRATPELARRFQDVLRGLLRMHPPVSRGAPGRLLDKSQSFTVRVGLLQALLRDCRPKFVLLTRNPFVMVWRMANQRAIKSFVRLGEQERLELSLQHWKNSMCAAVEQEGAADLAWWRFEDLLADPPRRIREICEFVELPYDPSILPSADDRIPWGSAFDAFDRSKWYPIRPDTNEAYLREIPEWAVERVAGECRALLERFGYARPAGASARSAAEPGRA